MSENRLNCLLILLVTFVSPALSANPWLKISSANFELYTNAGEKKGREAILYFEQVRSLFAKLSTSKKSSTLPVRIIAFQSEKEYQPYRINDFATAFYLGGRDRDYIVMKSIAAEFYPVAIHEYVHLIVKHSGLELPVWLNEGLAEVYSPLKPIGKQVRLGDILPGRYQELQNSKWIDLGALLAVDHNSPLYNEKQKAGVFYAESWALTHMLYLSNDYWKKFSDFLAMVKPGDSQAAAFEKVYGKSVKQMQDALSQYMRGSQFNAGLVNVQLEKSAESPEVSPAVELESGLVLADLLAVIRKRTEAQSAYESLAKLYPKDPQIPIAMARLAWMNSDREGMKRHFARAVELKTKDASVYFEYAMMLRSGDGSDEEVAPLLRNAIELQPDLQEAHYQLGFLELNRNHIAQAVIELTQVKTISQERASGFFRALAYGNYRLGRMEEARADAEKAVKNAVDPKDGERARELLAFLVSQDRSNAAEPAPVRVSDERPLLARQDMEAPAPAPVTPAPAEATYPVEGMLEQVDCLGKAARLRILAGGKRIALLIEDPDRVSIKSASGEGTHEFTCGPQKPVKVAIQYALKPDSTYKTEGSIRTLEFR